jgi:hypothetical protein
MAQMAGGCLCGAIRYTTEAEPLLSGVCHCRDCQRFTDSAFGALVALPKEALTFSGTMGTFTSPGGSGKLVHRYFCPKCGSSIAEEMDVLIEPARWRAFRIRLADQECAAKSGAAVDPKVLQTV